MKRRLLNLALTFSLFLWGATVLLWLRSYYVRDYVYQFIPSRSGLIGLHVGKGLIQLDTRYFVGGVPSDSCGSPRSLTARRATAIYSRSRSVYGQKPNGAAATRAAQ